MVKNKLTHAISTKFLSPVLRTNVFATSSLQGSTLYKTIWNSPLCFFENPTCVYDMQNITVMIWLSMNAFTLNNQCMILVHHRPCSEQSYSLSTLRKWLIHENVQGCQVFSHRSTHASVTFWSFSYA